ncbi:MAG: nucleotidyltransferase family protein [Pirellulales bacterium]|nr:nucleotidyltransferase family protein [Pirellulales bacterium]
MTIAYETHLNDDLQWALREGSMFFEEKGGQHLALQRIAERLREMNIPYAIAGGMAMFAHGYRRFTEDVDILVSRDGLQRIHQELEGLGYVPLFSGSKNLRDAESGVRIEFLVTGDYPGDGKPKPVAFPDPQQASVERNNVSYLSLPSLIELKLASGMTAADRLKDLADVQELIRILRLPREFAEQLSPFVREKYVELWRAVQDKGPAADV